MTDLSQWLTVAVGLSGVLSSGVIAYLAYSLNKQSQRAQMERSISDFYNQLMTFRSNHPEVLRLSRLWNGKCFAAMYAQKTDEDRLWALYYTYVELCINFSSAILSARESHSLDGNVYEGQYKPLVKLLLTEHDPFISSVLPDGKYISIYIKRFRHELADDGWDWTKMHLALAETTGGSK